MNAHDTIQSTWYSAEFLTDADTDGKAGWYIAAVADTAVSGAYSFEFSAQDFLTESGTDAIDRAELLDDVLFVTEAARIDDVLTTLDTSYEACAREYEDYADQEKIYG